jgi:protocatechuate 3,4-dioxygenase beta subunit
LEEPIRKSAYTITFKDDAGGGLAQDGVQVSEGHVPGSGGEAGDGTIGGGCDGCELMYIGIPQSISSESISPGWSEQGQKLLLTGTVFQRDGRTPAPNVIVYYWHTDTKGLYSPNSSTPPNARKHGHLRGWVKTDVSGNYVIKTLRPAPYPNAGIPAHIHLSIKEPNINEYYADLYFDDDKLYLAHRKKYGQQNRAGTEVLRVLVNNGTQIAEHDIILGLNIPNYPVERRTSPRRIPTRSENTSLVQSGLSIGEDCPSFIPFHAWGADKGTRACPMCRYGRFHGIEYFVGNRPNWDEIKQWLRFFEAESLRRGNELKVYYIYGKEAGYTAEGRRKELETLGNALGLTRLALTFVPSFADRESDVHLNTINPEAENTIVIFKHRTIVEKFVNLKPTPENFIRIQQVLARTRGNYSHLKTLPHDE